MMLDLRIGIARLFEDASRPPASRPRYRWPLWRSERHRAAQRATRVPYQPPPIAPLPFTMSCLYCRRGCHTLAHVYNCRARFS